MGKQSAQLPEDTSITRHPSPEAWVQPGAHHRLTPAPSPCCHLPSASWCLHLNPGRPPSLVWLKLSRRGAGWRWPPAHTTSPVLCPERLAQVTWSKNSTNPETAFQAWSAVGTQFPFWRDPRLDSAHLHLMDEAAVGVADMSCLPPGAPGDSSAAVWVLPCLFPEQFKCVFCDNFLSIPISSWPWQATCLHRLSPN